MRVLFEYDYKDYRTDGTVGIRPSVRGLIIKDGKLAFVYSRKYDFYSIPGGGIDEGETHKDTLIREVREETGLEVIEDSIREYGMVIKKEKGMIDDLFIQEHYFYLCDVYEGSTAQKLEAYEAEAEFELRWADPESAIETNHTHDHGELNDEEWAVRLYEREERLIRKLEEEGLI